MIPGVGAAAIRPVLTSDTFSGGALANIDSRVTDVLLGGSTRTWITPADAGIGIDSAGRLARTSGTANRLASMVVANGSPDQYVHASLVSIPVGGTTRLCARGGATSGVSEDRYYIEVTTGSVVRLGKVTLGAATVLSSNVAVAAADQVGIRVIGDRLEGVINGAVVLTVTDTDITTGTRVGVQMLTGLSAVEWDDLVVEAA